MKNISLLALAVAAVMSSSAFAETGTLNFTGNLNASTCTISPGGDAGAGASAGVIDITMGDVSFDDLATVSGGTVSAAFTDIDLGLSCTSAGTNTAVVMSFDPVGGTGLDASDNRLLGLAAGGATGAGIALVDATNQIIDLGSDPKIRAPLTVDAGTGVGTADLALRATYVGNGEAEVAGVANASLPFLLSYE